MDAKNTGLDLPEPNNDELITDETVNGITPNPIVCITGIDEINVGNML